MMNDSTISQRLRYWAATTLSQAGSSALPTLLNALTNADLQHGAAHGLAQIGEIEPLLNLMNNPNKQLRGGAIEALGMIGNGMIGAPLDAALAPIEPLLEALKDEDVTIREKAIGAIFNIAAYIGIHSMLFESSRVALMTPEIAEQMKKKLGSVDRPKLVEPMITALKDDSVRVRSTAAMVLGQLKIKDKKVVEALKAAQSDKDEDVRFRATEAMLNLGM